MLLMCGVTLMFCFNLFQYIARKREEQLKDRLSGPKNVSHPLVLRPQMTYLFLYVPSTPLKSLVSLIIHALSYFHFLHNYRTVPNTIVSLIYLSTTVRRPHPKKAVDIIMRFILSSLLTETFLLLLNINYPWPAVPFC